MFEKICTGLDKLLAFDVELITSDGEQYLCVFHDKSHHEDDYAIFDMFAVAHMVEAYVDKYFPDECKLGKASINCGEVVNCFFKMEKPLLSKEVLKAQYGVDCRWENDDDCWYQHECIASGECVYVQEWEKD